MTTRCTWSKTRQSHDVQEQAEFYDKEFKEIRDLTRKSKQDKIHRGIHIDEIKEWDEGIRKQKRKEEEVYQELRNVLDEIAQDEKREIEQDKQLELEKLKLAPQPVVYVMSRDVGVRSNSYVETTIV